MPRGTTLLIVGLALLASGCHGQLLRGFVVSSSSSSWTPGFDGQMHQEVHETQTEIVRSGTMVQETRSQLDCMHGLCRKMVRVSDPKHMITGYLPRFVRGILEKLRASEVGEAEAPMFAPPPPQQLPMLLRNPAPLSPEAFGAEAPMFAPPPPQLPMVLSDAWEPPSPEALSAEVGAVPEPIVLVHRVAPQAMQEDIFTPVTVAASLAFLGIAAASLAAYASRCIRQSDSRELDLPLFTGQPVPLEQLAPYAAAGAPKEQQPAPSALHLYLLRLYERAATA